MSKNKGLTLVELIVSFSILSLLMATVAGLLPAFVKQYSYVQNSVHADEIGTTLLDLIESELTYCDEILDYSQHDSNGNVLIKYRNKDLINMRMSVVGNESKIFEGYDSDFGKEISNGELVLVYESFKYYGPDNSLMDSEPVAWGYTSKFYSNNIIKNFDIKKISDSNYKTNVYLIEFELSREETGQTKKFSRMIQCINQNG